MDRKFQTESPQHVKLVDQYCRQSIRISEQLEFTEMQSSVVKEDDI